ncbi:MAG: 5'-3' exonuclease H3TH domain-containing protein [Pseudomonadota bacterium]
MKLLLVDGLNLVRRIFAALPKPESNPEKNDREFDRSGYVLSVTRSLQRALRLHSPSHVIVVFEQSGPTWRHRLFPDYKIKRRATPEDVRSSMNEVEKSFASVGCNSFSLMGYEADDIIATVATKVGLHHGQCVILSTDRNYCQLLSPTITVFDHFSQRYLDADMVQAKFGIKPWQIPHMLALAGDSTVSIPGIPTIGKRTAAKLIMDYGSVPSILEAADKIPGKLGSKLFSGKEDAALALKLFTLKNDIDLGINLNQYRYQPE